MGVILYGKLGRSMPLTLAKCGTLGGDIEMTATLVALANMRPNDEIWLVGRNSGEKPHEVGLPRNVFNPWINWKEELRERVAALGLPKLNYSAEEQLLYAAAIDDITREAWDNADEIVMWVGQHGTTNTPIPKVKDRSVLTKPQDAFMYYSGYLLRGINRWRDVDPFQREPIFLNADPRNYLKMRDMKWPLRHPVLTQYEFTHNIKHERFGDPNKDAFFKFLREDELMARRPERYRSFSLADRLGYVDDAHTWTAAVANAYSRLELNALLPGTPSGDLLRYDDRWENRKPFGLVINEARAIGIPYEKSRLHAMLNWVMPLRPSFVHGTWSEGATKAINHTFGQHGIKFDPKPLAWEHYTETMHTVRCTFTTPSSGSGWATTKPWEAFGLGVVCFFHPDYDTQDNILGDAPAALRQWLRVKTPEQLRDRVIHLSTPAGRKDWEALIAMQRVHFERNVGIDGTTPQFLEMINDRLEHR